jgi:YihY family inner membrane protein
VREAFATVREFLQRSRTAGIDQFAAGIAYFGFLALVPVLLLATAIVGFVLDDVDVQARIVTAITSALPGLEAAVEEGGPFDALLGTLVRRRGQLGLVGAASLVWVGLRLAASLMAGVEAAFGVGRKGGARARLRQLEALVLLGVVVVAGFAAASLTSGLLSWLPGPASSVVTFAVGAGFDLLLFLVAYRMLLEPDGWRGGWARHLPGAALGAAGWTGLKVFGSAYVSIRLQSAGAVYGTLAGVATVLVLFYLMARLLLTGALLSAMVEERRDAASAATDGA